MSIFLKKKKEKKEGVETKNFYPFFMLLEVFDT